MKCARILSNSHMIQWGRGLPHPDGGRRCAHRMVASSILLVECNCHRMEMEISSCAPIRFLSGRPFQSRAHNLLYRHLCDSIGLVGSDTCRRNRPGNSCYRFRGLSSDMASKIASSKRIRCRHCLWRLVIRLWWGF